VGDQLPVGEVVALMLAATQDKTIRIAVTGDRPMVCVASSSSNAWSFPRPVRGVSEIRVIDATAYIHERGPSEEWTTVELEAKDRMVESEAAAEGLNRTFELLHSDCRWNERMAAMDPSGTARVDMVTASELTVTVPTDPESQWSKNSQSERRYVPARWVLAHDGAPLRYHAPDGSRVFTFSLSNDPIEAPPAEGTQPG
jgi:hypothetical protein